jgi:hypothetical protein
VPDDDMLGWQLWQPACCGCGSWGGKPWQLPQFAVTGLRLPQRSLPWQAPVPLPQESVARL